MYSQSFNFLTICQWKRWLLGVSSKWSVTTALQAVNVGSSPAIPTKREKSTVSGAKNSVKCLI